MRLARLFSAAMIACLALGLPMAGGAQQSDLRRLETGNDSRGWEAVGRLDLGDRGFCTGALIAPDLVLTAAHCLFDKTTGRPVPPAEIRFLAGLRNGRAAAYRGVRRAVVHPSYAFEGEDRLERVASDLALIELDQAIRLPSLRPYAVGAGPARGEEVGVVSYARDRAEAASLQEVCQVLGRQPGVLVLSCSVDFGSSGAPIFVIRNGVAEVVSVVSAKAEVTGEPVALGTALEAPLAELRAVLAASSVHMRRVDSSGSTDGARTGGAARDARFLRP